jgi:hypothetical protein
MLGDFSVKVVKEEIFKPRTGNETYMKIVKIK